MMDDEISVDEKVSEHEVSNNSDGMNHEKSIDEISENESDIVQSYSDESLKNDNDREKDGVVSQLENNTGHDNEIMEESPTENSSVHDERRSRRDQEQIAAVYRNGLLQILQSSPNGIKATKRDEPTITATISATPVLVRK